MTNKLNIGDKAKVALPNPKVIGNGEIGAVTNIDLMNGEIYYTLKLDNGFDSPIKSKECLPVSVIQVREGEYETITCTTEISPAIPLKTSNLKFGETFEYVKLGKCVQRVGWNGKGMHVTREKLYTSENIQVDNDCLLLYNAQGKYNTWVPSITDIFAEDWQVVK